MWELQELEELLPEAPEAFDWAGRYVPLPSVKGSEVGDPVFLDNVEWCDIGIRRIPD